MSRLGLLGAARRWLAVHPRVPNIGEITTVHGVLQTHERAARKGDDGDGPECMLEHTRQAGEGQPTAATLAKRGAASGAGAPAFAR